MPYSLKKVGGGYKVISPNRPGGHSRKPLSKATATRQMRVIYANTKNETVRKSLSGLARR